MSRTDKDRPIDVRTRELGRPHVHDATCFVPHRDHVMRASAVFWSHETGRIAAWLDKARELGFQVEENEVLGRMGVHNTSPFPTNRSHEQEEQLRIRHHRRHIQQGDPVAVLQSLATPHRIVVPDGEGVPERVSSATSTGPQAEWNVVQTAPRPAHTKRTAPASLITVVTASQRVPGDVDASCWHERGWGPAKDRVPGGYEIDRWEAGWYGCGKSCSYCHPDRSGERARTHRENRSLRREAQAILDERSEAVEPPQGPAHVMVDGRCLQCDCDDHSLPEDGAIFAAYELPCPVDGDERVTRWSFGAQDVPLGSALAE